jgi:hypothetical protein
MKEQVAGGRDKTKKNIINLGNVLSEINQKASSW